MPVCIPVALWLVASSAAAAEPRPAPEPATVPRSDSGSDPDRDSDRDDSPPSRHGLIRELGDWGQYANPAIAALIALSEDDSDGLADLARGCLITVVGTSALKQVFNFTPLGERPSGGDASFPSGHAAAAMCAPAFLHERYRELRYTVPLAATGSFVAYSRVWARKHHWRDVLASTVLALVVAHNTTERHEDDDSTPGASIATLTPLSLAPLSLAPATPSGIQLGLLEGKNTTALLELGRWSQPGESPQGYWGLRIQGSF